MADDTFARAGASGSLDPRVAGVLAIPLHGYLGLELTDPANPAAGVAFTVGEPSVNNNGVLHGGVVTAVLDVASYLATLPTLGQGENAVTHDLSASLLRAVDAGARVAVAGEVLRRGRRLVFVRAEARCEGRLVAVGQVTKSVVAAAGGR